MNIAEYAEQLFNLAYSQEMIDFITSLDGASSDEWRMKVTAIQGYYFWVSGFSWLVSFLLSV